MALSLLLYITLYISAKTRRVMAHSQNRYHDYVKTGFYSEYTVVCDCIC